jgi:hypothetical protein
VALNVDGRQIPAKPLQSDFENNGYIRRYMGLYTSTGIAVYTGNVVVYEISVFFSFE